MHEDALLILQHRLLAGDGSTPDGAAHEYTVRSFSSLPRRSHMLTLISAAFKSVRPVLTWNWANVIEPEQLCKSARVACSVSLCFYTPLAAAALSSSNSQSVHAPHLLTAWHTAGSNSSWQSGPLNPAECARLMGLLLLYPRRMLFGVLALCVRQRYGRCLHGCWFIRLDCQPMYVGP